MKKFFGAKKTENYARSLKDWSWCINSKDSEVIWWNRKKGSDTDAFKHKLSAAEIIDLEIHPLEPIIEEHKELIGQAEETEGL